MLSMTYLYMPWLSDDLVDELRDNDGRMFGRWPVQGWVKPERVTLVAHPPQGALSRLNELFEGRPDGPRLEFVVHDPWYLDTHRGRRVRPKAGILEEFLSLSSATFEEIRRFALKYGPLQIYYELERLPAAYQDQVVVSEYCEVWTYFAKSLKALLRIAAQFRAGRPPDNGDWDVIGAAPLPPLEAKQGDLDPMNPSSSLWSEKGWKVMAHFVRKGTDRDRAMWLQLLNCLL